MQIPEKRKWKGKYDPQLKVAIAREYLTTDQGYGTLSKKYDIPETTIKDFVVWYKTKYDKEMVDGPEVHSSGPDDQELKIIALQMLIENASKELGIDLVKKFGTKQSKK